MSYELTYHARQVLDERRISLVWMERVLLTPTLVQPDLEDKDLENPLGKIVEFGDRVLRVIVNIRVVPQRGQRIF